MSTTIRESLNEQLYKNRKERVTSGFDRSIAEVNKILQGDSAYDKAVLNLFGTSQAVNDEIKSLTAQDVWTHEQIRKVCFKYGLRFVKLSYYSAPLPMEVINQVGAFLKKKGINPDSHAARERLFVVCPADHLELVDRDTDPMIVFESTEPLYTSTEYKKFEHVFSWGADLTKWRRLKALLIVDPTLLLWAVLSVTMFFFCYFTCLDGAKWYWFIITPILCLVSALAMIMGTFLATEHSSTTWSTNLFRDYREVWNTDTR